MPPGDDIDAIVAAYTGQQRPEPKEGQLEEFSTATLPKAANPQLFENSPLGQDDRSSAYYNNERGLFGDKPPNLAVAKEKPEHRLIVYLKASGLTNQEIADKTGYGYQWVCQLVRQPWFRARFIEECEAAGRDAVRQFLQGEVVPSLETLVEIRDSADSKDASRVCAANSLLDRFLGKPTQRIENENTGKGLDDARKTVQELEEQVQNLRVQNGLAESSGEN